MGSLPVSRPSPSKPIHGLEVVAQQRLSGLHVAGEQARDPFREQRLAEGRIARDDDRPDVHARRRFTHARRRRRGCVRGRGSAASP